MAAIIRDEATTATLEVVLEDPAKAPFQGGVHTLDGYRFSQRLAPYIPAKPSDAFLIIGSFIPRSIWPEKSDELTASISAKYQGCGASAQYLSPIGYSTLMSDGYGIALLLLAAISAALCLLLRASMGLFSVAITVVAFRFSSAEARSTSCTAFAWHFHGWHHCYSLRSCREINRIITRLPQLIALQQPLAILGPINVRWVPVAFGGGF